MNQIQFFINTIALTIVLVYTNFKMEETFSTILVLAIPINVFVLLIFIYIYFMEAREQEQGHEFLVLSMVEETKFNHKAYSTLLVNEGRYVSFFIWGASITVKDDDNSI